MRIFSLTSTIDALPVGPVWVRTAVEDVEDVEEAARAQDSSRAQRDEARRNRIAGIDQSQWYGFVRY